MIVKRNFSYPIVWKYIKAQMLPIMAWTIAVWMLHTLAGWQWLVVPFVPVGVLGSALAIFVAFRNNSAYARWWEARTIWGGVVNSSRILARLVITFTDSHAHQQGYDRNQSERFKNEMVYRCIAWVHLLRLQLRNESNFDAVRKLLSQEEYERILQSENKPNLMHLMMGRHIYQAMANGTLGGFDSFQMEGQMLALANYQGSCERIKNTPLPKQYDFFTRWFVGIFAFLLPPGLLSVFPASANEFTTWLVIPLCIAISGVFVIMERTGAANENPFENLLTDVPLTALCNTVERDLREMLGEKVLPPASIPHNGYLY